ncbi:P63C domain-containing protein [Acetobacter sp. DsW_059]|uniref:P63C domain-containing protein n=1 Tax=Acetobacter sp. DsW_059 TaxID=1670661 RepID=UPI001E3EB537|nr:P63C domain-containing protein [Acetobacter sp. DsW_059]
MTTQIMPFHIEKQSDGELRISDIELAGKLGYKEVKAFRRIIRTHEKKLNKISQVLSEHLVNHQGGGRDGKRFWLTEAQALFMISRSDTEVATDIMVAVSVSFVEMRKRFTNTAPALTKELLAMNILSPEVRVWEKKFEPPFFEKLHRVLGVRPSHRNNHPNCGKFINKYVYEFLFGDLGLEIIRDANPSNTEYHRAFKHHQMLKPEHDEPFRTHIKMLTALLSVAQSQKHFNDIFNTAFPKKQTQIGMMFNEISQRVSSPALEHVL